MAAPARGMRPTARSFARMAIVALFAAIVLFVVWFRSAPIASNGSQQIHFRPIGADRLSVDALTPFELRGAWQLTGDPALVTGLSGIDMLPDGRLLAVGDRGSQVVIAPPGPGTGGTPPGQVVGKLALSPRHPTEIKDAEAVTVDPATGRFWTALETDNRVVRYAADGTREADADPPAMEKWPENVGPESMARLGDGRFVIVGEKRDKGRDRTFPILLFPGDPVEGGQPLLAHLAMPDNYKPVDAAPLPDGRMLVLGRTLHFPFWFDSLIAIIEPAAIKPAARVQARPVAAIRGGPLSDNYEGIAAAQGADGRLTVWLVSDDNQQQILQSTKLLELSVDPAAL